MRASRTLMGPRSSGEVPRQQGSTRSNQRFVNSFLCLKPILCRAPFLHIQLRGYQLSAMRGGRRPERVGWSEGLAVICENLRYSDSKNWNEFLFKPWVSLEPQIIAWTWMGQGNSIGPVPSPCLNCFGD